MGRTATKKVKRKYRKRPGLPKRSPSAYNLFVQEQRKNPNLVGSKWQELKAKGMVTKYEERAAILKKEYFAELEKLKPEKASGLKEQKNNEKEEGKCRQPKSNKKGGMHASNTYFCHIPQVSTKILMTTCTVRCMYHYQRNSICFKNNHTLMKIYHLCCHHLLINVILLH
jgi:hypothetical protein